LIHFYKRNKMDAFDDAFGAEVDPAAEFLAKEQEELADLGEDLGFAAPSSQEILAFKTDEPMTNGHETFDFFMDQDQGEQGLSRGIQNIRMREEPECIRKWKIEQEERLRVKDEEEALRMEELRAKAKKELDDWYKRYEDQLVKTKANNRSAQEEFVAEINNIVPGSEWERVSKHCDFNPKSTRHSKDVSRMRALLLQLKQNPPATRS